MFEDKQQMLKTEEQGVVDIEDVSADTIAELKIGQIARQFLRIVLKSGKVSNEEVSKMMTKEYSKKTFGIDFPLLVLEDEKCDSVRYYAESFFIGSIKYRLCSQWYEVPSNNDRPLLLSWLEKHITLS